MKMFLLSLIFVTSVYSEDDPLYIKAIESFKSGNYTQVISQVDEIHKAGKESYETHFLAGHANWKINEPKAALGHWYSARKNRPQDTEVILNLIKAHNSLGQTRISFALCREGLKNSPDSRELKLALAALLIKVKRSLKALEVIEGLKSEDSNDYRSLALESKVYFDMGNYEKSETSMKWALAISPSNPNLLNNLAMILEKNAEIKRVGGDKEGAKKILEEAKKQLDLALTKENKNVISINLKRIGESLNAL